MSEQRYHAAVAEDRAETLWLVADVVEVPRAEPAAAADPMRAAPLPGHRLRSHAQPNAAEAPTFDDEPADGQGRRRGSEEEGQYGESRNPHDCRVTRVALWDRLRGLDLAVEGFATERRSVDVSSQFTRVTTTVVLRAAERKGAGRTSRTTPRITTGFRSSTRPARQRWARSAAELDGLRLFDGQPKMAASADYRRWAFESAALDLALRQNGLSLGSAAGRDYRPVRFVVSTRGDAFAWLEHSPDLELKLDPENDWDTAVHGAARRDAAACACST